MSEDDRETWKAALHYSYQNALSLSWASLTVAVSEMIHQGYLPRTPLVLTCGPSDAVTAHRMEHGLPYLTAEVDVRLPDDGRWYVETPDGLRWGSVGA